MEWIEAACGPGAGQAGVHSPAPRQGPRNGGKSCHEAWLRHRRAHRPGSSNSAPIGGKVNVPVQLRPPMMPFIVPSIGMSLGSPVVLT